ncbi:MAG: 2-hydroxyacid dehydrogenase [Spirochaetes bacterium]|jgi:D-lactate dehydrogenase|nr:2-hydroxyacid dehydrogenase [Spirochaetota bacterium]
MKIAFFDTKPYDRQYFSDINRDFSYDIHYFEPHLTPENLPLTKGFDAVIIFVNDTVTAPMIDYMYENGIKLIALRCAGYNNVDFKHSFEKIHIVRVPAYSPHAIAEHALALMMGLNRHIHRAYQRSRELNFTLTGLNGFDMFGKTAGVIGTGKIGKVLCTILKGMGMNVLSYDLFPDEDFAEKSGIQYVSLDDLISKSDIISLNCPLTPETEYLINKDRISKMKDGVMIINTGRGKLIKTADLVDALKSGKIGSAGLDVYEEESNYFFEDYSDKIMTDDILARLLTFNNVIITSHQAFFTNEAMNEIAQVTLENIKRFEEGGMLENEVCYRCIKYKKQCNGNNKNRCF